MTEPIANKIGVANLAPVYGQTNNVTIHEAQQVALIYSDPVPDLRVFQGRDKQCSALNTWLADPDVSMMAIRGEGGIGKSTLMAKVFAESQGFAGKFWADVRTGTPIAALAERSLQEFGVLPEQVRSLQEKDLMLRLLRQLQQGRYLLAIDNLESVLTAEGDWQGGYEVFLDGFQNLGSESVLLLAGREYPHKYHGWRRSRWLTVNQGLTPSEGAALLENLEVADTIENRAALSVQVQGNPLALSLIAGWLRDEYRQPEERLVNHLSQHADLFQLEGKHRGEANISVDRVLQWSMDRLTPAQQYLLTRVSVLRGTFNWITAAMLVLEQPVSDTDLPDLERRSLLQELPRLKPDAPRLFQLQPRIREFIQKHAPDLTTAHERAIAYFWNQRQTQFAPEDTQAAVTEYKETSYHLCQLGHYADAADALFACDEFLRRRGYYEALVDLYQPLYTDWQPTPDQQQTYAGVCTNLGIAYDSLGQYQQAINFQQQSLAIAREIGNRQVETSSLIGLGNAYFSLGQYQQAIAFLQKSLAIQREIGSRPGEAASLGNLGNVYHELGQYQQAIAFQQQSLAIQRGIGNRQGEANSLGNLGDAYYDLGQYQQAIDFYQQSLAIAREIGDRQSEANSLIGLGNAYDSLGQYQQAIAFQQQSLAIQREIGSRPGEAASLGNLGNIYHSLGRYLQAIDLQQQSLVIRREIGDRIGEADSLGNLGTAYQSLGEYQQAIDFHQQSLVIRREIAYRKGEALAVGNLGTAYQSLGEYQQAIDFHQQSLAIRREIGDRNGEANSLLNLGIAYDYSLGQHPQAIVFYQQSLAIAREIGDRQSEANSLLGLGNAYQSLRQYQQAIDFQQQSLAITREIGDRNGEANSLFNMGIALARLDRHYEALQSYQQALAIYDALKLDHRVEPCKNAIAEQNRSIATQQRWQTWGLWFAVGLAIALLIWWLQ
ncbi:MAG: tetratricopeptide repeat protein [Synechococcales cyanobacterium K44_A2020_017]|nr:tetratricopeptide repeat protein [Synechococcales cyanobacterium K44_A2020_017]